MKIDIAYNDELDEFSYDLSLEMRLKNYIIKHFYPAYTISDLAPIYLLGGGIRDLICAKKPKDLDFVVLGKENMDFVLDILDKYGITFSLNRFGGFKINYKGTMVDLWLSDDLFSSMQYNIDGLYYDLNNDSLMSLTFDDYRQKGIKLVNPDNNIEKGREKKLIKFDKKFRGKTR